MPITAVSTPPVNTASTSEKNKGFAYNDVYGFAHVVEDLETAQEYSGDGKVYAFEGRYGGGYAKDTDGHRAALPLPNTRPYGNDEEAPAVSAGTFTLINSQISAKKAQYDLPKVTDDQRLDWILKTDQDDDSEQN